MARLSAIAVLMGAFVLTALLLAQGQSDQNAAVLKGRVVNASSGEPVRKAQVRLNPVVTGVPGGATMVTVGDDGVFILKSVSPGKYQLNAQRTGFVNQAYGAPPAVSQGTTIDVASGQTLDDLVIRMVPQGAIAGRVFDDDGDPIQRADVSVWRYEYPDGERRLVRQPAGNSGTNDLGEYRLYGLPPGSYFVSATTPLSNSGEGQPRSDVDSIATYYPRSPDAKSAAAIEVAPGSDVRGVDIRVLRSRLFQIQGKVDGLLASAPADPTGRGGRGGPNGGNRPPFVVSLDSTDSAALPRQGKVNADGTFVVSQVAPGSYTLRANGFYEPQPMMAHTDVEVTQRDVEGVSLRLLPPVRMSGSVGIEPPGAAAPRLNALRLMFWGTSRGGNNVGFPVQADGSFQSQLQPDAYRLEVLGIPDGYYLKAVKLATQDIPDASFDFSSGGSGEARVGLMLAPTSGVLAGSVMNSKGAPAIGARVTVVPASGSPRRDLYPSQNADGNGNFAFKALPPGKYQVFAWEQIDGNAWMNKEFRRPFESSAAMAEISDSGTASVALISIEGAHR